jgi:TRAP-type C4-dicarboxylate transport system substrate-binding protein
VFFTRTPVENMNDLRKLKMWRWEGDDVGIAASKMMGLQPVPVSLKGGRQAYVEGKVDGFVAIPSAALNFQWSTQARYLVDLRLAYIWGCVILTERSFQKLAAPEQAVVQEAAAHLQMTFDEIGRQTDDRLLSGLFEKQGMVKAKPSESFRSEFWEAARVARENANKLVPQVLVDRVLRMLADYRAEHAQR